MRCVVVGILSILAACSFVEDRQLVAEAEEKIAAQLKQPDSAEFRSVRVSNDPTSRRIGMVCGEVSSRNGFGELGRYRRFLFGKMAGLAQVELDANDTRDSQEVSTNAELFKRQWRQSCN